MSTFARLVCNVVGLSGGNAAEVIEALHVLFALYLEFQANPAFHGHGLFDAESPNNHRCDTLI